MAKQFLKIQDNIAISGSSVQRKWFPQIIPADARYPIGTEHRLLIEYLLERASGSTVNLQSRLTGLDFPSK